GDGQCAPQVVVTGVAHRGARHVPRKRERRGTRPGAPPSSPLSRRPAPCYFRTLARTSTTKTRVSSPLIVGGLPSLPYPSEGGRTSRRRLPTFAPVSPLSKPGTVWPVPIGNLAGVPDFQLESNSLPVSQSVPW